MKRASQNRKVFHAILTQCIALVGVSLFCESFANPTLNDIAAGQVSIQQNSNTLVVNQQSQKSILNWKNFNIEQHESVHFAQPQGGITLNRINPAAGVSQIYGKLSATGQIILINPAGIYFGPSAFVNVGGLIATTANLSDENFLNNKYIFSKVDGYQGAIINAGQIIAAEHGLIALAGANVTNSGLIQADFGHVILASGDSYTINFSGNDLINFSIDAKTSLAANDLAGNPLKVGVNNQGHLIANGGHILITAQAAKGILDHIINMQGVAEAHSVQLFKGEINLLADAESSPLSVAATLDVSGKESGTSGGAINITGKDIAINNSLFDASGDVGGGNINIGGNAHGLGALVNAQSLFVGENVKVIAHAITQGDGGNIVFWSNEDTRVHAKLCAHGGALAGNGGFVETSGHNLDVSNIEVNLLAPNGKTGLWLLDPYNVTINNSSTTNMNTATSTYAPTASGAVLGAAALGTALNSANITVVTTGSGSEAGNITFADSSGALANNWTTTANTLTLQADNNIAINNIITLKSGQTLNLIAGNTTTSGSITLTAGIRGSAAGNGTLNLTSGTTGNVTVSTALGSTALNSLSISGTANLNANVTTTGEQAYNGAVNLGANVTLTTTNNNISFATTIDNSTARNLTLSAGAGNINLFGNVGSSVSLGTLTLNSTNTTTIAGSLNASSLTLNASGTTLLNGGSITTTGTQTYGDAVILGANTLLTATNSNITFSSTVDRDALARSLTINNGTGNITFTGNVGAGSNGALGDVVLNNSGTSTFTGSVATANLVTGTGTTAINGGSITTTGASGQIYQGAVTLNANTLLNANTSAITFNSTINSFSSTARNLDLTTSGLITFTGAIGNSKALGNLSTSNAALVNVNGGSVNTSGWQNYGNTVTLGSDTNFTTSNDAINFTNIERDATHAHALTLNAGTGTLTFTGSLGSGANGALGAITFNSKSATTLGGTVNGESLLTNSSGTTVINGGSITTSGAQTYNDAIILGADTTLASTSGSAITLGNTVNGAYSLTLNTLGAVSLDGAIGATTPLTSLVVNSGTGITLNGGSVSTTGVSGQNYQDAVTLGANTTLNANSGSIIFARTLNSFNSTARTLAINSSSTTTFNGAVGNINKLSTLNTNATGTTVINGGSVTTNGAQTYADAVILGADTTLTTTNNIITFSSTVARDTLARNLTLTTGTAAINFNDQVGSVNAALGNIQLNNSGTTTLAGALYGASLTTGTGTIAINGGNISTSATTGQNYNGNVTLNANTTLNAANAPIRFAGTVNSATATARDLTINTSGTTTFTGVVGTTRALANLSVNGGAVAVNGGRITTTNNQTYTGAMSLGTNTRLTTTSNGSINLASVDSTVTGVSNLILSSGTGVINLSGAIGEIGSLSAFTATTTGATNDFVISNNIHSLGAITITAGRNITLSSGSLIGSGALTLTASAGAVQETGIGMIQGTALTVNSVSGIQLENANTVTSFKATNTQSSNINFANNTSSLQVNNIIQAGGDVSISNSDTLNIAGVINPNGGSLTLGSSNSSIQLGANLTTNGSLNFNGLLFLTDNVTFTGSSISFSNGISGNKNLTLNASTISINGGLALNSVAIAGTGNNNTLLLNLNNAEQNWNITNENSGNIASSNISFNNIQNLTGGNGADIFNFSTNGSLTGVINGGEVTSNTLKFTAFNNPIALQLNGVYDGNVFNQAGAKIVEFKNINNVYGNSSAKNSLTLIRKSSTLTMTSTQQGYVNDAITFNGFSQFISSTGKDIAQFTVPATYNPLNDTVMINNTTLTFTNFIFNNIPSSLNLSPIVQQPLISLGDKTFAPVTIVAPWVLKRQELATNIQQLNTTVNSNNVQSYFDQHVATMNTPVTQIATPVAENTVKQAEEPAKALVKPQGNSTVAASTTKVSNIAAGVSRRPLRGLLSVNLTQ